MRASLHAGRIELHTNNLAAAEDLINTVVGPDKQFIDVQRFGDRLDLIAHDPIEAAMLLKELLPTKGLTIDEIRFDEPTLENTFVARLRSLGQEVHSDPFPGRRSNAPLKGQIAIGAANLTKQFGNFTAVKNVSLEIKYGEIYGLLGANGAGKTTTIKMLCGLLPPTLGRMTLAGKTGSLRSGDVRRSSAICRRSFRSITTCR